MTRLTQDQLDNKQNFINRYIAANNAATGSTFDANANVSTKNVATLNAEINKDICIQLKRRLVTDYITKRFDQATSDLYLQQLEEHLIYANDESQFCLPYCAAVTLYPFLNEGLKSFGGSSVAPKHLSSFNGGFINLLFALSSQFAGAVATVEYLNCFDYFARQDYGSNYLDHHSKIIQQELQQVIYAVNQPAAARSFQSVFWNISILDKHYFKSLFQYFRFPDGSSSNWESVSRLQKFFMHWFNQERTKALLTFPVVTLTLLNDGNKAIDTEYAEFAAKELSEGNSFFIYTSNTVDSLSSCCRLRNNISDQLNDFQYSLGAGGVQTGSINVLTLNVNRFVQKVVKEKCNLPSDIPVTDRKTWTSKDRRSLLVLITHALRDEIQLMHKWQVGTRDWFTHLLNSHMLPAYDAGYISMNKQYSTLGVNGVIESAEYLGYDVNSANSDYMDYIDAIFSVFSDENKLANKLYDVKFNTEQIPAEGVGVKFANWDKQDGLFVPRDCYNSYLYPVESDSISIIDKFILHGKKTMIHMDGGSALHVNLEDYPNKETFLRLFEVAIKEGCPYFCFNISVTVCNQCGYIDKRTLRSCSKCGSTNVDYAQRIIGYLVRTSKYSAERQEEAKRRMYHKI